MDRNRDVWKALKCYQVMNVNISFFIQYKVLWCMYQMSVNIVFGSPGFLIRKTQCCFPICVSAKDTIDISCTGLVLWVPTSLLFLVFWDEALFFWKNSSLGSSLSPSILYSLDSFGFFQITVSFKALHGDHAKWSPQWMLWGYSIYKSDRWLLGLFLGQGIGLTALSVGDRVS